MATIWILAANSGTATLYSADAPLAAIESVQTFENPEARVKITDQTSDRQGRSFSSQGDARHALEVQVDPKEQEQIRFAKEIADRLEQGRIENAFERLIIVAAPSFLGSLRAEFTPSLNALISLEMDKDYTSLDARTLRSRLPERL